MKIQSIVPKQQDIVTVQNNDSVSTLLKTLNKYKIHACPVVKDDGKVVGLADQLDILSFTLDLDSEIETKTWKNQLMQFSFSLNKVEDIMDLSTTNPLVKHLTGNDSIADLCQILGAERIHRVCLFDNPQNTEKITSFLTQSYVFEQLFGSKGLLKKEDWYEEFSKQILNETLIGVQEKTKKTLITVKGEDTALKAFQIMKKNELSALAVVNEKGQIIGNLSASDLRGLEEHEFNQLEESVTKFIDFTVQKAGKEVQDLIFVLPNLTVKHVIDEILKHRVQRIYIVNREKIPVGVVSMSDVFSHMSKWM